MEVSVFTKLIEKPEQVNSPVLVHQLEDVLAEYPYFQAARALHVKGLKNLNSFKYNGALKRAAAYTTNREVLFQLLTSDRFKANETAQTISERHVPLMEKEVTAEEILPNKEVRGIIETDLPREQIALPRDKNEAEQILDPALFEQQQEDIQEIPTINQEVAAEKPTLASSKKKKKKKKKKNGKDKAEAISEQKIKDTPTPKEILPSITISDPKEDEPTLEKKEAPSTDSTQVKLPKDNKKGSRHSFAQWLQLTQQPDESIEPTKESEEEKASPDLPAVTEPKTPPTPIAEEADSKKKKFELIDRFIEQSPKIVPQKQLETKVDIKESTKLDKNELMTVTLAKIYVEQKRYKKAIQAYKILSLKYPEKSGFFADRINEVRALQQDKD
jgi:hypothetical protein